MRGILGALAAVGLLASGAAPALQDFTPAVIFDMGGKFDKSFNEAAYQRRREVQGRDRHRLSRVRDHQREPARPGAAPHGAAGRHRDGRGLRLLDSARDDRGRVPGQEVRDHRFGGRQAQRPVGGVQGARGQLPGRHGGGPGLQDRQGRLRRRHGHPADPQFRLRLRAGRQAREPGCRGDRELHRHHAGGLERPGARRRARHRPVRPGRRRGLRRGRRHRPRRAAGRGRQGQAVDRRRQQPEPPAPRQRADLDAEAGRRRRATTPSPAPRTAPGRPAWRAWA